MFENAPTPYLTGKVIAYQGKMRCAMLPAQSRLSTSIQVQRGKRRLIPRALKTYNCCATTLNNITKHIAHAEAKERARPGRRRGLEEGQRIQRTTEREREIREGELRSCSSRKISTRERALWVLDAYLVGKFLCPETSAASDGVRQGVCVGFPR